MDGTGLQHRGGEPSGYQSALSNGVFEKHGTAECSARIADFRLVSIPGIHLALFHKAMKRLNLRTLLWFLISPALMIYDAHALDLHASDGVGKAELLPNQQAFLNLPEDQRKEFLENLADAKKSFEERNFGATQAALDKASAIFADSPEIHTLRGCSFVETRKFDEAMDAFRKAAALSKDNPSIEFNIAEVHFVTKKWKEGLAGFSKVLRLTPADNVRITRLIEFKILLCQMKLGNKAEVSQLASKYGVMDESPYPFYARSALAFFDNKPADAADWRRVALRIFPDEKTLAPWNDTMIEIGFQKL